MGFKSVYRALQDVFPEVDSRALKAVAIEHSKDADLAVEVVLVEVIPNLPKKTITVGSSSSSKSSSSLLEGGGETSKPESTMDRLVVNLNDHEQSTKDYVVSSIDGSLPGVTEALDASDTAQLNSHTVIEPVNLESLATSSYHDANGEPETECSSRFLETFGDNIAMNHDSTSSDSQNQGSVKAGCETVDNETIFVPASNHLVGVCETNLVATQESGPTSSKSVSEKEASEVEFDDLDGGSGMSSVLTRSEEKCSIELLEEIIEDAKNNKQALVSAMDSVVDLFREVESKEKAAEEAKEEATQGCSDILAKANEVKNALLRAKEANDMHAGEVNAEKAILATELKELQLRLFTLSDERKRSLAILDEMRKALESRLAAALDEIATAEQHKLENERAAKEALLYQESQMEKVVEEAKKLKLVAEENTKLQEFLMDRGRAVDILQGEISVKCQDVLLLKEKFDKGIPLTRSRSLSSSQTSSILASSSSSFRSVIKPLEPEPELETFESLMKSTEMNDSYDFVLKICEPEPTYESLMKGRELDDLYGFVDKSLTSDVAPEETASRVGDRKKLQEDGWEFFDN
ncbi:putative ubiquitin system component CUE [Helianthus anomalus]